MTAQEILNEIHKLPPTEQKEVFDSLSENLHTIGIDELRLQKALFGSGLLREFKPARSQEPTDFTPIKINGKPLSETIIEERR